LETGGEVWVLSSEPELTGVAIDGGL
jgi:hypothetical protein